MQKGGRLPISLRGCSQGSWGPGLSPGYPERVALVFVLSLRAVSNNPLYFGGGTRLLVLGKWGALGR